MINYKMKELAQYILYSIISAVIFLLLYSLWFNPSIISNSYENIKEKVSDLSSSKSNLLPEEDPLTKKCRESFNTCSSIFMEKYGGSVSIIEIERFDKKETAEEFYNTWKGMGQIGIGYEVGVFSNSEYDLPIVLVASKAKDAGGQLPIVIVCNSTGELAEGSKMRLLC